jgi:putative acetyltransferase
VGLSPAAEPAGIELRKLYVARSERRSGLGARLVAAVERAAGARGARFIELWSDVKFVPAHRFYERHGYVPGTQTRRLGDLSDTVERHFRKAL